MPVIVVLDVFATILDAILFPVILRILNVLFAFNVVLPVIVAIVLAYNDIALIFKLFPPIVVLPPVETILIAFVVIVKLEVVVLAVTETKFELLYVKAIFATRFKVLKEDKLPPTIPSRTTSVFAPK